MASNRHSKADNYRAARMRMRFRTSKAWALGSETITENDAMNKRGSGWHIQQARAALFRDEPLCRHCLAKGRTTAATERDHIIPLHKGGTDDVENTQPLCAECHKDKTRKDMGHRDKPTYGADGWPLGEGLDLGPNAQKPPSITRFNQNKDDQCS